MLKNSYIFLLELKDFKYSLNLDCNAQCKQSPFKITLKHVSGRKQLTAKIFYPGYIISKVAFKQNSLMQRIKSEIY